MRSRIIGSSGVIYPASTFVEDFLGEGRMVRRLALIRVREVTLAALAVGTTSEEPVPEVEEHLC